MPIEGFQLNLCRYAAVLAHVPAGDVIARAGNLVGIEEGAFFAVARGSAAVLRRDFSPAARPTLGVGDDFGDLVAVGQGTVGFPASLMAAEGGAAVYCLPQSALDAACAECEFLRLTLRGKAKETIRELEAGRAGGGKSAAASGLAVSEALPAAQRGAHVVLVADAVPMKRELVAAAEAAGNVAGEYAYDGTLDDAFARAKRLVPGVGGAMTLMMVMPPPPKGLAAVRVVRGADTSEASLGGDDGAAAADPAQKKFWTALGQLCKPWGGVALAHSPGLDGAIKSVGEDVAALMIEMVGVEVVPPYELGREMGSEPFEATQATITRDAAKKWRTDAVAAIEKGDIDQMSGAGGGGDNDKRDKAAAAAVSAASASPAKTKKPTPAASRARPATATARGGKGKPSLAGLEVHGAPAKKKKGTGAGAGTAVAAAAPISLTRSELICRKLGIEPAAAAAQLANVKPVVSPPSAAVPLASSSAAVIVVPEPDTPALACLLLLESRQMSYRARQELNLVELQLAVSAAEAAEALKLQPGTVDLSRFKRRGDALVSAVRRLAIKRGVLVSTPKDAERAAARIKAAEEKKRHEAELLRKREKEIAAVALEVKTKKDKAAAEAAAAAAVAERRRPKIRDVEGSFLERYEEDMRKRVAASRPSSTRRSSSTAWGAHAPGLSRPASAGRARIIGGVAQSGGVGGPDDVLRRREESDRLYLRAVVKERLRGIYRPGAGGRIPRDDAGLVEIIKTHAKLLGIRWPKVRRKKHDDGPAGGKRVTTKEAKAAEERRLEKAARNRRRACEKLRRVDFMRRYETDMARRDARRKSASEFGDADMSYQHGVGGGGGYGGLSAAPSTGPPSPRSVGAGMKYYDDMLADADDALEALGYEKSGTSVGSARSAGSGRAGRGRGGAGAGTSGRGGSRKSTGGGGGAGILKGTARSRPTSAGRMRGGGAGSGGGRERDAATRERLEAARSALDHLDDQAASAATKATANASVTGW